MKPPGLKIYGEISRATIEFFFFLPEKMFSSANIVTHALYTITHILKKTSILCHSYIVILGRSTSFWSSLPNHAQYPILFKIKGTRHRFTLIFLTSHISSLLYQMGYTLGNRKLCKFLGFFLVSLLHRSFE